MNQEVARFGTVGVVIPTYERPELTLKAIKSVLSQTYPIDEITVVDGGSSLESQEKLRYLTKGLPVEIIATDRLSNPGISRQIGLERIETDWVAFLDSDDEWLPEKMFKQLSLMRKLNSLASATNAYRVNNMNKKEIFFANLPEKVGFRKLLKRNMIINSSAVIERKLLLSVEGISTSYSVRGCEDYASWLRVSTKVDWLLVNEPLINYLDDLNEDSIRSQGSWENKYSNILAILDYSSWKISKGDKQLKLRILAKLITYLG